MPLMQSPLPAEGAGSHRTTDQLVSLEYRRQALQRLVKITQYVERLRLGLESALQLGQAERLPPQALTLYKTLSVRIRNLSDREVGLRYKALSRKVQILSEKIVTIVDKLDTVTQTKIDDNTFKKINQITDEFRRLAQTTVALQVLMERRGLEMDPVTLAIPQEVIQEKIQAVKARESDCREKVIGEVRTLEADMEKLLASPRCQASLRPIIEGILLDLETNRKHIEAGYSIQDLPVDMEIVDFSELHSQNIQPPPNDQPASGHGKHDRIPPGGAGTPSKPDDHGPENLPSITAPDDTVTPLRRLGKNVLEWLNTPWSVTWKNIIGKSNRKR